MHFKNNECNKSIYEEIDIGNNNKLIFFKNINFWDSMLPKNIDESDYIDILTYNFNIEDKRDKSMYNKLVSMGEKGLKVRLFYRVAKGGDRFC